MGGPRETKTEVLIAAMRVLARDIQSQDGVANAAIAEAADRLEGYYVWFEQLWPFNAGCIDPVKSQTGDDWVVLNSDTPGVPIATFHGRNAESMARVFCYTLGRHPKCLTSRSNGSGE